jgi:hypothetical protein
VRPINFVFVCEKETKRVICYDVVKNSYERREIDMDASFKHNFAYCQTVSSRLFIVGGGDIKHPEMPSLVSTFEVLYSDNGPLQTVKKGSLQFARHGHSVTSINDRFLVATGSCIELNGASRTCEFYNVELDTWFPQASMNKGRYYHSSCVLNDQWVYVFAGIEATTKKYFNSIERFDSIHSKDNKMSWELLANVSPAFTSRQGMGCIQIN